MQLRGRSGIAPRRLACRRCRPGAAERRVTEAEGHDSVRLLLMLLLIVCVAAASGAGIVVVVMLMGMVAGVTVRRRRRGVVRSAVLHQQMLMGTIACH